MKHKTIRQACSGAFALLFSLSALAGGGGNGGGDDNSGNLPAPNTCTSNCGFATGANPSLTTLRASSGPFSVQTSSVARSVDGFGGGTIYYPSNVSRELAAITIAPGFTATRGAVAWWGPLLASHGFEPRSPT